MNTQKKVILLATTLLVACGGTKNVKNNSQPYKNPHFVSKSEINPKDINDRGFKKESLQGEGQTITLNGKKIDLLNSLDESLYFEEVSEAMNVGIIKAPTSNYVHFYVTGKATPVENIEKLAQSGNDIIYHMGKGSKPIMKFNVNFANKKLYSYDMKGWDSSLKVWANIQQNKFASNEMQTTSLNDGTPAKISIEGAFYGKNAAGLGGMMNVKSNQETRSNVIYGAKVSGN